MNSAAGGRKRPRIVTQAASSAMEATSSDSVTSSEREADSSLVSPSLTVRNQETNTSTWTELVDWLRIGNWEAALSQLSRGPFGSATSSPTRNDPNMPTPLAMACRYGAPLPVIAALVAAAPETVRMGLDSRGTPLHEAVSNEDITVEVVAKLLEVDEALGGPREARAALFQDIDGFTPLHLLFRRRIQSHSFDPGPGDLNTRASFMQMLEVLVKSCPEAIVIPDRGEYEEPPIVYALKAHIYAPALLGPVTGANANNEDNDEEQEEVAGAARLEQFIFDMVQLMLRYCPPAASQVFTGYRGQYTALHSAVFHGRHPSIVGLLLNDPEETLAATGTPLLPQHQAPSRSFRTHRAAALLANTQGETPLHFCAMRGEQPRTVSIIVDATPQAILERDATGLTPIHWVWVRFASTLLALDHGETGNNTVMRLQSPPGDGEAADNMADLEMHQYVGFANLEQEDYELDMLRIKKLDPPVDFLRMRHIPPDVLNDDGVGERANDPDGSGESSSRRNITLELASICVSQLQAIRDRYMTRLEDATVDRSRMWSRREAMICHFWTKVVALLKATERATLSSSSLSHLVERVETPLTWHDLVHSAFRNPCFPPGMVRIVATLLRADLSVPDLRGSLPVHYAAQRHWHTYDWPQDDLPRQGIGLLTSYPPPPPTFHRPAGSQLLQYESLRTLQIALELSPLETLAAADARGRLVLHHAIDTFVLACVTRPGGRLSNYSPVESMLSLLHEIVILYPDALQRRDGVTGLYPFQQASAAAVSHTPSGRVSFQEELPLSISYALLRSDPTLLSTAM
jgi:ankyrin repeat protein